MFKQHSRGVCSLRFGTVKTKALHNRSLQGFSSHGVGHIGYFTTSTDFGNPHAQTQVRHFHRQHSTRQRLSVKPAAAPVEGLREAEEAQEDDPTKSNFNWFKNWWPVQIVDNLETDRPNKVRILGKDIIVWKGHSGKWIAMDDECPHRLAPLSEGRIEKDGNLLCSYHAWRFNESGKCVKIPHAEDEKAHSIACNSPRSAVQTYPCKEYAAVLWVWPDDSVSAHIDSSAVQPPIEEEVAAYFARSYEQGGRSHMIRYLPYGYDVFLENSLDPAHYPVSHHGIDAGISRYNAKPISGRLVDGFGDVPAEVAIEYATGIPGGTVGHIEFRKPSVVIISSMTSPGQKYYGGIMGMITPISAGKCLIIAATVNAKQITRQVIWSPFQRLFQLRYMDFMLHQFRNNVLDGDNMFLHQQDLKIRKKGPSFKGMKNYYAATDADVAIKAFRDWFEGEGDYGKAYGGCEAPDMSDTLSKEQTLDRYEQHTKHCKFCTDLLRDINRVIYALKTAATISIAFASILLFQQFNGGSLSALSIVKNVKFTVAALFSVLSASLARILEKKVVLWFYFKDRNHADMD